MKKARLLYRSIGCHPAAANTRYGQNPKRPGVSVEGARWEFTEPRSEEGVLRGDALGGEALARMERGTQRPPAVRVIVECADTDLKVFVREPRIEMSKEKEQVIKRFLAKSQRDPDGSVQLGWASLAWDPKR